MTAMMLTRFGLSDPLETLHERRRVRFARTMESEENEMDKKEFKKASAPVVVKLEKKGDVASGKFISLEESTMYPSSYALKYNESDVIKVAFVNSIAKDLIEENDVKKGTEFILEHNGMAEAKTSGMKYHTYTLFFK